MHSSARKCTKWSRGRTEAAAANEARRRRYTMGTTQSKKQTQSAARLAFFYSCLCRSSLAARAGKQREREDSVQAPPRLALLLGTKILWTHGRRNSSPLLAPKQLSRREIARGQPCRACGEQVCLAFALRGGAAGKRDQQANISLPFSLASQQLSHASFNHCCCCCCRRVSAPHKCRPPTHACAHLQPRASLLREAAAPNQASSGQARCCT